MTAFLKQSTAVDLAVGPFLDATDGVTAMTGLTISQADVRLKKNNGAWAQVNDATSATHEELGWYEKEFDATDTNTVGRLTVSVQEATALPVWHEFWVLEEAIYDALFGASAAGYAIVGSTMVLDLTTALDDTPTTNSVGDALLAARAQGFGKWTLVGTSLKLYASDGTTVLRDFTLDSSSAPTSRTPV